MSFRSYYHCFNIIYLTIHLYQFSSVTQSCLTLCGPYGLQHARPPCPSPTPELAQTLVHQVSDAIRPSYPLSSPSPPAFNLSSTGVFSNESVLRIRWPKYWSFSFSISPFDEYSGLIPFRMDWFDLLAVQGTLKRLLQVDRVGLSRFPKTYTE